MAKQIITLEVDIDLDRIKESGGYPLPAWLPNSIVRAAAWITGVRVLNISPVYWAADEDPEDYQQSMVDKGDVKWVRGG